ncbi:MAG: pentapeptide repeat-containing protein [Geminocystis sp.]|nr:pentapeptide repeat-containing protein [Geminocystis sp.]HIK37458.1 pentapeptide repeat-containing protein [Geminocystis sp. M7585_C2015_104]MCS7147046.1 pentapeptide repeat-containing protein [Geminocystis sp.]MCX8079306.1 pentapeptide repeat-containing protein [Geminocystis sp.]MDW8115869.1 pentapeptide repeat-containing protein [Geminocystis sp.]
MKTNLLQFLGAPVFTTVMATAAWGENLAHISQLLQTRRCPGCDLRGAGLVMTDLRDADLRGAALRGANLSRANLAGADLSGADLSNASLHGANLNGANLSNATLDNTDLRGAYLVGAYLEKVDLSKANVQGVVGLPSSVASAQQFYLWGVLEDRRGNFVGAANFYSQAISLEPTLAHAYLARAVVKSRYGQIQGALKDAEKAQSLFQSQQNQEGYLLATRFLQLVKAREEADAKDGNEGSPVFVQIVNAIAPLVLRLVLP